MIDEKDFFVEIEGPLCPVCNKVFHEQKLKLEEFTASLNERFNKVIELEEVTKEMSEKLVILTHASHKKQGHNYEWLANTSYEAVDSYIIELDNYIHEFCGLTPNVKAYNFLWRDKPMLDYTGGYNGLDPFTRSGRLIYSEFYIVYSRFIIVPRETK